MMKKQFVLKRVNVGSSWHHGYKLIQFETVESYRHRGGKISTPKTLKFQPAPRNHLGAGAAGGNQVRFNVAA